MDKNDYEKAKQKCWEIYASAFDIQGTIPNEAFNWVFKQGYQLGKAHAKGDNGEWIKNKAERLTADTGTKCLHERTMIAAMAMQGLLSNECGIKINDEDATKSPLNVAKAAIMFADALLTELNKPKNETD